MMALSTVKRNQLALFVISIALITGCQPVDSGQATAQVVTVENMVEIVKEMEVTRIVEIPVTFTPSLTLQISTTPSTSPTITLTPTITPTPKPPIAKITTRSVCHYGPGAAYLYKYGLVVGSRMEIIGRNAEGDYAYIQAIGGNNPCWVDVDYIEIDGDLFSVAPIHSLLPYSEFYGPPPGVSAVREGDKVTVSWTAVWMSEDDYGGYLIEAWLCQDGQLAFTPLRSDENSVTLIDEPGCLEVSSGKLYTAEKHGYTNWVPIPWPDHE